MNEPRIYRHSPIQLTMIIVMLIFFSFVFLLLVSQIGYIFLIPFAIFMGIIFLSVFYSMTQKTIISDDGISTQTFLGEKSLRWGEISRVSGRRYGIKLHNFDGDVTVVPDPQLPAYAEIIEWIGIKRPDLFNPLEYSEMKRSWLVIVPFVALALALAGMLAGWEIASSHTPQTLDTLFMPLFLVIIILIVSFGLLISSPHSLTLDGKSFFVKYLFGEKTLRADEIASIDLRFTQTRNGKNYFILLTQTNKKTLRISGLNLGLPIVYLVLKNWHKKNTAIGQTN